MTEMRISRRQMQPGDNPGPDGRFGAYGGRFVPETLIPALEDLARVYQKELRNPCFQQELHYYLSTYAGRPTPLTRADRLERELGARIYLKREDLTHTGAHKINNTLGQVLLARRMGRKRIIAETGAGQHGVATATAAALFDMECVVYMGEEDMDRQALNVFRMELLGATVVPVRSGSRTLKDAINEAIRDWVTHVDSSYYVIGSVVGPHPYPVMVRDFQRIIGEEARSQIKSREGRLPDFVVACVGGGSNAMGTFYPFARDRTVRLVGVEAGGEGLDLMRHSASLTAGQPGVLHGAMTYLLQDEDGQIIPAHSVSAGLDYPGVGPEHAFWKDAGRVEYVAVDDEAALEGFAWLARTEGIIPALESAHAVAHLKSLPLDQVQGEPLVLVCLSGRGDKDVAEVARLMGEEGI